MPGQRNLTWNGSARQQHDLKKRRLVANQPIAFRRNSKVHEHFSLFWDHVATLESEMRKGKKFKNAEHQSKDFHQTRENHNNVVASGWKQTLTLDFEFETLNATEKKKKKKKKKKK